MRLRDFASNHGLHEESCPSSYSTVAPVYPSPINLLAPDRGGTAITKRTRRRHGSITLKEALDFDAAWRYAIASGFPPNLVVTFYWAHAPADRDHIDRMTGIKEAMYSWIERHAPGTPFVWLEVREATHADGEHVHFAVHIPPSLLRAFSMMVETWIERGTRPGEFCKTASDVRRIWNWVGLRNYMLKGGTEKVRAHFGINRRWSKDQGLLLGKRTRVAQAIGPTRRAAARFKDRQDLATLIAQTETASADQHLDQQGGPCSIRP